MNKIDNIFWWKIYLKMYCKIILTRCSVPKIISNAQNRINRLISNYLTLFTEQKALEIGSFLLHSSVYIVFAGDVNAKFYLSVKFCAFLWITSIIWYDVREYLILYWKILLWAYFYRIDSAYFISKTNIDCLRLALLVFPFLFSKPYENNHSFLNLKWRVLLFYDYCAWRINGKMCKRKLGVQESFHINVIMWIRS